MDKRNIVNIATGFDKAYCGVACVMIKSLIDHASIENQYNIYILHNDIPIEDQYYFLNLSKNKTNVSISFINIEEYDFFEKINLYASRHTTKATYYRLFLPYFFENIDKIIYIDGDCILLSDISKLYAFELDGNCIAGARDVNLSCIDFLKKHSPFDLYFSDYNSFYDYFKFYLGFDECRMQNYINAGVMLMNLDKMRKENWYDKMQEALNRVFLYHDQDIINFYCKDSIVYLEDSWNVPNTKLEKKWSNGLVINNIHSYSTGLGKPWLNINTIGAKLYWNILRTTPYYEEMLLKFLNKNILQSKIENNTKIVYQKSSFERKLHKLKTKPGKFFIDMFLKRFNNVKS
ncbi:glycosyltransferase family 8 protein [Campylobacter lari]|nr:glycosyltransferase family 8 protein [Campylobacter lari]